MRTASAPDSTSILSPVFEHRINLYGYLSPIGICLTLISSTPPFNYPTATQSDVPIVHSYI
jgi:hypothetical protein